MICSGEKKEEYRAITYYWMSRLRFFEAFDNTIRPMFPGQKMFDCVELRNGYSKSAPSATFELEKPIRIDMGKPEWGAEPGKLYFVLELGKKVGK